MILWLKEQVRLLSPTLGNPFAPFQGQPVGSRHSPEHTASLLPPSLRSHLPRSVGTNHTLSGSWEERKGTCPWSKETGFKVED